MPQFLPERRFALSESEGDRNMHNKRITGGILAVLTATVVACGSLQAAAGRADTARGSGIQSPAAPYSGGCGPVMTGDPNGRPVDTGDPSGPWLVP